MSTLQCIFTIIINSLSKYTIISLNQIVSKMNISDRIINFYKLYMDFLNVYLQVNSDAIIKKYNLPKKN